MTGLDVSIWIYILTERILMDWTNLNTMEWRLSWPLICYGKNQLCLYKKVGQNLWSVVGTMYSIWKKKCDTLVNCQLSTVNCHLLTIPKHSTGDVPWKSATLSAQSIPGKILFSGNFIKDTIFLRICVNFMTFDKRNFSGLLCHEISNEFLKTKFFKIFLRTSLTFLSWKFTITITHGTSVITCHHLSTRLETDSNPASCKISVFLFCLVCKKFDKIWTTQ